MKMVKPMLRKRIPERPMRRMPSEIQSFLTDGGRSVEGGRKSTALAWEDRHLRLRFCRSREDPYYPICRENPNR